jgi:chromosome segregation ATPase
MKQKEEISAEEEKIEGLRLAYLNSQKALADNEAKVAELAAKYGELQKTIPGLQEELLIAEKEKNDALTAAALDPSKEGWLKKVREKVKALRDQIEHVTELAGAVEMVIEETSKKLPGLRSHLEGKNRELFYAVTMKEVQKARNLLGDQLARAYAANRIGGNFLNWARFVSAQLPEPAAEDLQRITKEIESEYAGV